MLEPDELRALDDFRFTNRLPSRAADVRELLKRGLASDPIGEVDENSRSQDFGGHCVSNGSRIKHTEGPAKRLQLRAAILAVVEMNTRILRHRLGRLMLAARARNDRRSNNHALFQCFALSIEFTAREFSPYVFGDFMRAENCGIGASISI